MTIHTFICDNCETSVEDTNTRIIHRCQLCGDDMRWDLSGIGIAQGDYEHISSALAMSPSQIPEHRKLFPSVDVLPDGRPRFTSVKQQSNYLDATGFYKHEKKGKKKIKS